MNAYVLPGSPVTANDLFKMRYPQTVRWSTLVALTLMVVFFLASPKYVPRPYVLRTTEIKLVQIQEILELPLPPKELVPPRPIEPVWDELEIEEIDPGQSLLELDDIIRIAPPAPMRQEEEFTPSSVKPELLHFAQPDYPEIARMSGLQGTVLVAVMVGPGGGVIDAQIVQGVHPILNRAAIKAALKCRFSPGLQRGRPVKARMAIPYRFVLN